MGPCIADEVGRVEDIGAENSLGQGRHMGPLETYMESSRKES